MLFKIQKRNNRNEMGTSTQLPANYSGCAISINSIIGILCEEIESDSRQIDEAARVSNEISILLVSIPINYRIHEYSQFHPGRFTFNLNFCK